MTLSSVRPCPDDFNPCASMFPLKTRRTLLKPFTHNDLPHLSQLYSKPEVMQFLGGVKSESQTREILQDYISQGGKLPSVPWLSSPMTANSLDAQAYVVPVALRFCNSIGPMGRSSPIDLTDSFKSAMSLMYPSKSKDSPLKSPKRSCNGDFSSCNSPKSSP